MTHFLLTFTYKNTGYSVNIRKNYRKWYCEDGLFLVKKLTKLCHSFVLVPEIGEHGNFHWHASVTVRDKMGLTKMLQNWNRKKGFTKMSNASKQTKQSVSFISPQMEAKLNTHIYLRKYNNEIFRDLKIKCRNPLVKMVSKTTRQAFRTAVDLYRYPAVSEISPEEAVHLSFGGFLEVVGRRKPKGHVVEI